MSTVKVLLIDDEHSIHNVVIAYLKAEGYEYQSAMDGPSGLNAARTFQPDIIILDVMLPGMDGIEILANLRRESNVYVIMLTAMGQDMDQKASLEAGANEYMLKPFNPRLIRERVAEILQPSEVK